MSPPANDAQRMRWRLLLGEAGAAALGGSPDEEQSARETALDWLYDREHPGDEGRGERRASLARSQLTVPDWIDHVHRLFPRETVEIIERDAVQTYALHEIVTDADCLRRIEPSETLLQAILRTKHLMNPEVRAIARAIVAGVVKDLLARLARTLRTARHGARSRRRTHLRAAGSFDPVGTIRRNLDTWDGTRIVIRRPLFLTRRRRQLERWQIILLVDESSSMLGSVIHAAVLAACLWGLPGIKTHLCIFDTAVVDLTARITDPVETLMQIQLGGGTDIGRAVAYASQLVESPARTIVAVVSDFFEGADPDVLVRRVRSLVAQGVQVLGLAALDEQANPSYDRELAQKLAEAGAHMGAMTPGALVQFLVDRVKA